MSVDVAEVRKALVRWKRYLADDEAALRVVQAHAAEVHGRLAVSRRAVADLSASLQRWDEVNAAGSNSPGDAAGEQHGQ